MQHRGKLLQKLQCACGTGTPVWKESLRIALPMERAEDAPDATYDSADAAMEAEARLKQVVKHHVRFLFRHRVTEASKDCERPFALAYFRLQPSVGGSVHERASAASALSTMVKDGPHELFVYKVPSTEHCAHTHCAPILVTVLEYACLYTHTSLAYCAYA